MSSGIVIAAPVVSLLFDDAGNAFLINDAEVLASQKGVLIAGTDGSNVKLLKMDADGTARIAAASLPLPTGAATETTSAAIAALLTTIDADTSNLDVLLSTRSTEATLAAAKAVLDTIDAVLDTIYVRQNDRSQKTQITNGTNDVEVVHDPVDSLYRLAIDGKVAVVNLSPPAGTNPVQIVADTPLSVTSAASPHDTEYVITSGKTFTLQSIIAGSEGDSTENGSRVDIIYDNGTEHLVAREYISGFSTTINPDTDTARDGTVMTGTGTEKIIVRRVRLSGGALEIDAVAKGFES